MFMMKKKITIISIIAVFLLSVGGYITYQKMKPSNVSAKPKEISVEAKIDGYSTEEELTNASDLIVIGKLDKQGDSEVKRSEEGDILNVYRMSDFRVSQVIKDATTQNIVEDSIIPIYENEGYDKKTNTTYHVAGYEKMEITETYMLFLSYEVENKYYIPLGVNFGKMNIDSEKETELFGESGETEKEINDVQADALDEYKEEINEENN